MIALTDALADAIEDGVRHGASTAAAFQAVGLSRSTLNDWRRLSEGSRTWADGTPASEAAISAASALLGRLERARASTLVVATSSLMHNATTLNPITGWYDTQAADKLLSKNPDNHRDWYENKHVEFEQAGTIRHEHMLVKQLSPIELEAAYEAILASEEATEPSELPPSSG